MGEVVQNILKKINGKWYVYSEDGSKKLGGPYDTKEEAVKRLRQIEFFKQENTAMQYIITNLSGLVRHENMESKDFLVVPVVMIVEGVLNGSNGPLLYPAEELEKVPEAWNYKPVVVYHPEMNGRSLSACSPEVINSQKVGVIMNTSWDGRRLRAEAWMEENRIREVDARIMENLESGQMMEVSTGLFTEVEETAGVFNGVQYDGIARNFRPDHLALLPDQVGACSISDGAGLLRLNMGNGSRREMEMVMNRLSINDMSHDEIRRALYGALEKNVGGKYSWVEDVYEDWFVYSLEDGSLYKQEYTISSQSEMAVLIGDPVEVHRKIIYEDMNGNVVGNSKTREEDEAMGRDEIIASLITHGKWEEGDRKFLEGLTDDQLTKMQLAKNEEGEQTTDETQETEDIPAADEPEEEQAPAAEEKSESAETQETTENKRKSVKEYIDDAPAEIREVLKDGMQTLNAKRKSLIDRISSEPTNKFTDNQLSRMTTGNLESIVALIGNKSQARAPFLGLAPVGNSDEDREELLTAPTMNFAKGE